MQAHEVPTHVQAEDRVLLWFTFPQIVAMTAVAAIAYGIYHYAPFGPSGVRIAFAALFALGGLAVVAGRVGGRRLPLVAADLLRYALGTRRYAGPPAELVRGEPPAPVQSPGSREGDPLRLLARRVLRRARRAARKRKEGERRTGRLPFRPQRLFGRRGGGEEPDAPSAAREDREQRLGRRGFWKSFLAAAVLALLVLGTLPLAAALAQEPEEGGWTSDEIEFQPPPVVPGRRLFVEALTVTGERAEVVLRAATDLDLRVRAYGGPSGSGSRFFATVSLAAGERVTYDLPLNGPSPSLVFSWEDGLGQAGAVSLDGERLPWPLPAASGELCDLRVVSVGWTPGAVAGTVASTCASTLEERVQLAVAAGHHSQAVTALLEAEVTGIAGTVTVTSGVRETSVSLVPGGETRFRLPVAAGEGVHALAIEAGLQASLRVALPPLVELTHVPERTERLTETATVDIPAFGDTVTETVTVPNGDGTFTEHSVTASCHVPASTVSREVVFTVVHPERVEATVVQRAPLARTRAETLTVASSVWADGAYRALAVPEPEPEPTPVTPVPAGADELGEWFEEQGWEWPW
ncbi:MAG: hypothetical protein OXI03_02450 [Chloroflexota bacterium]|nr:hypothetical protein [Chloroflexota bacterium]MDE2639423.1 hypothetical protein [Chloroflexota bacterium]MXY85254.1 hypothetical protein [Chloroflexota bacterium]